MIIQLENSLIVFRAITVLRKRIVKGVGKVAHSLKKASLPPNEGQESKRMENRIYLS